MSDATCLVTGEVSRDRPQGTPDNSDSGPMRHGPYDENYQLSIIPTKHALSDEGSYFVTTTPTPGTGIANDIKTVFSDTVPWLYLFNSAAPGTRLRMYLDYIKFIITVVPASATACHFAMIADMVPRALTTNNTTAYTPVSPNTGGPAGPRLTVNAQSSVTASAIAASSASKRVLARGSMGGLPIIGDQFTIVCGATSGGAYQGLTAAQAVCSGSKVSGCPPIILDPGTSLTVHLWFPGNSVTAASVELEIGHWER